jgi:hypothetical protein
MGVIFRFQFIKQLKSGMPDSNKKHIILRFFVFLVLENYKINVL